MGLCVRKKEEIGAGDRIRTGDINLGKVALYQLSYSRAREEPWDKADLHSREGVMQSQSHDYAGLGPLLYTGTSLEVGLLE